MASFVTEVLASSGKLEKEDLSGKISKMSRKVEETKEELYEMINKRYADFLPSLQGSEELMIQVDEVSKEMDALKNCIENEVQQNIQVAVTEYAKLKQQLEKNTVIIEVLGHLKEVQNMTKYYVDSLKVWKLSQVPLLGALSSELTVQRENLIHHLGDEWKRLVIWRLPPSNDHVCFTHKQEPSDVFCFYRAGQVLVKFMLKPVVMYPFISVTVAEQQEEGIILALQGLEKSHDERSTPSQVYSKLLMVLKTLHKHLLDVSIGDKKLSAILGELIWEEMSRCIIHECLVHSIPNNSSQLENYSTVIKQTEEFEKSLKEMEFLQRDSTDLLKYARDVNCHFASKKCKDVIVAARKLMTSKMHNTVKITPDYKVHLPNLPMPGQEVRAKQEVTKEVLTLENAKQLSAWSLCLPACRISESVQQLMDLAINTLCEAIGSSTYCALQLFFTVRNIFQLFYDVVPTYHKENLLKFPHLAAIQHNNCMYLAHHLLTLGHHFKAHLPQPHSEGIATFVDMVPGFRRLGARCFLAQMNVQRAELLERLSTAHNFCNLDDEDNYIAASKAVRQDISSEGGEHLHTLCQTIIEEGPLVFTPLAEENKNKKYQEEVPLYVKKWGTFKELVIVLRANLQEIVDRWTDGKGPLAVEFSSTEIKNLIRALFQNTERRAVALTKIK
uniref:Zw10 kinetochore protein n=1 Tax=Takifugu rubripes TaxID=31033 RepID=A0A674P2W3_TAKRU